MKQAIRNVLGVAGLLLMIASLVWISFHQEKRPAVYRESKATQPQTSKPFAVVVLDPGHGGRRLRRNVWRRHGKRSDIGHCAPRRSAPGLRRCRHIDDPARGQLCLTGGSCSVRESGERKHFYQYSFQRRQQTGRERRGNLLCCTSDRLQALLSLRGCRFSRGRRPIRRSPKAKVSPVSFRKRWWRGPAPSIAGRKPNNFL